MPGPILRREAPLCWAHRGDSDNYPENTVPAFEAAVAAGADGIELDVTLSADGRLVVLHDATLERTTDGEGRVSDLPWDELAMLDAGSWFDPRFTGTRLPLLADVLEAFAPRVLVNVEIKPEAACVRGAGFEPVAGQVAALVRELGLVDRVLVSSFNFQTLVDLRGLDPDLALGVLFRGDEAHLDFAALARGVGAASFHLRLDALTPEALELHHRDGRAVFTWARPAEAGAEGMRRALDLGVDGFFANDPGLFLSLRQGRK